jgi:hypothetical protein
MGVTEVETLFGRTIRAYNKERTICDIVRNRNNMRSITQIKDLIRNLANKRILMHKYSSGTTLAI